MPVWHVISPKTSLSETADNPASSRPPETGNAPSTATASFTAGWINAFSLKYARGWGREKTCRSVGGMDATAQLHGRIHAVRQVFSRPQNRLSTNTKTSYAQRFRQVD